MEIYDTKITEDKIIFDMEIVDVRVKCCYYGPVNGEKTWRKMSKGWEKRYFGALQPDTEYSFLFCDKNENVIFEIKERTAPSTLQVEYSAAVHVGEYDKRTLKLTADISGYKMNSSYLYFKYEYTNMLGEKTKEARYYSVEETEDTENGKSFTIEVEEDLWLTAGEVHDITMWLEVSYGNHLHRMRNTI